MWSDKSKIRTYGLIVLGLSFVYPFWLAPFFPLDGWGHTIPYYSALVVIYFLGTKIKIKYKN